MTGSAEIRDANAAHHFLRNVRTFYKVDGLAGWAADPSDRWLTMANRIARRIGPVGVARVMGGYRGKKAGIAFLGVRCDCCNALLTDPQSVAAGRGPKCMTEGK